MDNLRSLKRETKQMKTLKEMTRVYGEIASNRMNKVRESVLHSREYLESIYEVFDKVRYSYVRELMRLKKKRMFKRGEKLTLLSHNGKTVAVFISANTKLYGDLVHRVFRLFLEDVKGNNSEATIVGKIGESMFTLEEPDRPYSYFDMPDTHLDQGKLEEMVSHLVKYERIRVFYGKFKNTVTQEAAEFELSADLPMPQDIPKDKESQGEYLFEPSLEEVLRFFEKQIFGALLSQIILESQLAKYASRLVAMDRAEQNIGDRLSVMKIKRLGLRHRLSNKKQLNMMVAVRRVLEEGL